jgi:hypothetical protein
MVIRFLQDATEKVIAEVDADSLDEAKEKVSEGNIDIRSTDFVGVSKTHTGSVEVLSEDDSIYTVVGTSAHHPGGFIRRVEAGSADEAREIVDDGDETILAVFEGDHESL